MGKHHTLEIGDLVRLDGKGWGANQFLTVTVDYFTGDRPHSLVAGVLGLTRRNGEEYDDYEISLVREEAPSGSSVFEFETERDCSVRVVSSPDRPFVSLTLRREGSMNATAYINDDELDTLITTLQYVRMQRASEAENLDT